MKSEKDSNKVNPKRTLLIIISVLVLVFIGILVFSSSSSLNVDIDYEYVDFAEVEPQDTSSNIIIGKISIENKGFMTSRVILDNLVLCLQDDTSSLSSYRYFPVRYSFSERSYDYMYNGKARFIDIKAGDTKTMDIYFSKSLYTRIYYDMEKNGDNNIRAFKSSTLYLHDAKDNTVYSYCKKADPQDAIHTINFTYY